MKLSSKGVGVGLLSLVVAALVAPALANAQAAGLAGAIVFKNTSGSDLVVEGESFVNRFGDTIPLRGSWNVRAGAFDYLRRDGVKMVASKFAYKITTADGSSRWTTTLAVLDEDGDFVVTFTAANLREHLRMARPVRLTAGPVVFSNRSGADLTVEAESYENSLGRTVPLRATWTVRAGALSYLEVDGAKIIARKFSYKVSTADGTSRWVNTLKALDADGDFIVLFDAVNYRGHLDQVRPRF